jgi:hypothetical protein
MTKHDTIFLIGLVILSILTSFMFIFYGMGIIMAHNVAGSAMIFAYVTTAYGLANIAILSIAWSSRDAWSGAVSKLVALCFFGVFIMNRFMAGFQLVDLASLAALAVVLALNYFAVQKVVARR